MPRLSLVRTLGLVAVLALILVGGTLLARGGDNDTDNDGIPNGQDNCEETPNPDQSDVDGDGVGDVCDNCPFDSNPLQEDSDGVTSCSGPTSCTDDDDCRPATCDFPDFPTLFAPCTSDADCEFPPPVGNGTCSNPPAACDTATGECSEGLLCTIDPDCFLGICNIPGMFILCNFDFQCDAVQPGSLCNNPPPNTQSCVFGMADGVGDACDNCVDVPNPDQSDVDGDSIADGCDNCPDISNADQSDADNDGVGNLCDNCPGTSNADQSDLDGDDVGDDCDDCPDDPQNDVDGDGICGDVDNCPADDNADQSDMDGDGVGDACDPDADGDGIPNEQDNCPTVPNPAGRECPRGREYLLRPAPPSHRVDRVRGPGPWP